nr:retrovirus-related Pol polyprotein from transposon TNT 1-94 [Tanacetum cinerariifolium]
KVVPTTRTLEMPLPGVCTPIEEMMKKLPVKDRWQSTRTRHALDRMCLYVDVKEHELGDLGEPANYKDTLLDPESDKWLNAMNVEMQYMEDNEVWVLVDLPPNGKTVGSKWLFKKKTDMVSCYTDAGYLTDADDLKSQTGYVLVLNGCTVDWKSTKQSIFATSSTEAEYIATHDASKEAVCVRKFISGLGVVPTIEEPIKMQYDNT